MKSSEFFFVVSTLFLLAGCSSVAPDISTVCVRDDIGNYKIKWETEPLMEGALKVYVSNNPDHFDLSAPAGYADIKDEITTFITNDNITRKYFQLTFNDKYSRIIGSRSIPMDRVDNFRDVGGYYTVHSNFSFHDRMTRWGMVFRSGKLDSLSDRDTTRLNNLKIKTLIDFRSEEELRADPIRYTKARIINIPIPIGDIDEIKEAIQGGRMRKGDAMLFMQDFYLRFVSDYTDLFAKAFDVFLDKKNYPILVNCSLGKDRVGFFIAMLLSSLDIPRESIMKDYMESNEYIRIEHFNSIASQLDNGAQECITTMLTADELLLSLVFDKIRKEYGSIDKYLSKGLRLTDKKREKLKDILLY